VDGRRSVEQRLDDPPVLLDAVLSLEAHALALHRRVQQRLVRREALAALRGELHVEVDLLGGRGVGPLGFEQQPHAGCRVELDDELIGLGPPAPAGEAEPRRALEDEPQLGLGDGQVLAGADEERDPLPAPVVDLEPERRVGLRRRVGSDPVDPRVTVVLPPHIVGRHAVGHGAEDRAHRVLQRVRVAPSGGLHRGGAHDLHQVVHDHVAKRPDGVVEVAAVLDPEVLGHRYLHARDVVAVPDRLEHRVGEPQVEDLDEAHLPEEVVDPIELRLGDVAMYLLVEGTGGVEVVAEWLLHHDAGRVGQAGLSEPLDDRAEQEGWDLEVEDRMFGALDRRRHTLVGGRIAEVPGHVESLAARRSKTAGSSGSPPATIASRARSRRSSSVHSLTATPTIGQFNSPRPSSR
jgi:hypothetical protein